MAGEKNEEEREKMDRSEVLEEMKKKVTMQNYKKEEEDSFENCVVM